MSAFSRQLRVLNSLLFVRDFTSNETPHVDGLSNIWTAPSCIAVACVPDCDGETSVKLGPVAEVRQSALPLFDGILLTPSRKISVDGVLDENLLLMDVEADVTRLRIWTDGSRASEYVYIGVD